jgi:AraC-like DNA-binding protein
MGWNPVDAAVMPEPVFRLATEAPPARASLAAIQETLGGGIWRFDFEPSPDVPFFGEARMSVLPGLAFADVATSEGRTRRTSRHLVDDQLLLNVCLAGTGAVSQCGREAVIGVGEAVLSMGCEHAAMRFSASRFLSFRVPARAMRALVPGIEDRVARPIPRESEALKLLLGYAGTLGAMRTLATPAVQQAAVAHVYDLLALALAATGDVAGARNARGVRAARLRAIKADIVEQLDREDVSVATFAARHRMPERYVRRLFEEDGMTFTEFVLEQRLARARQILINPCRTHQKISAIAAEAGFNNLSYFNQSFRRRFGVTPSDARAQVQRSS